MPNLVMLIGRILAAAIFIEAGFSEFVHMDQTVMYFALVGLPFPEYLVFPVTALEFFGGLAVLFGWKTRLAAYGLAAFALGAAWIGHSDWAVMAEFQAFMKDVAIAGGYLFLAATGPGRFSIDHWQAVRAG